VLGRTDLRASTLIAIQEVFDRVGMFSSTPRDTRNGGSGLRLKQTGLGPQPSNGIHTSPSYSRIVIFVKAINCDHTSHNVSPLLR